MLRLRDCTNRSKPSSRGTSVKASVSGRTSEGTAKELSALSSALRFCREETKVSLTKLARLTKASGISEVAIETLKIRIKDFAEQKNNVLDELDLEVDSLREGFEALFGGGDCAGLSSTYPYPGGATSGAEDVDDDIAGPPSAAATAIVKPRLTGPVPSQQVLPEALSVGDLFDEGILKFLSMGDIAKGVAYTCKRWNRAARSEPLWKHLVKRDFMEVVAPLCQVGIVLSNPTSPDQMSYLGFAESRFKADATIKKWLSSDMKEHPAVKKLLMYKPDEIGIMSWLAKNDKIKTGADCLSMLARGVIIPEFFKRYEQVAIDAYMARKNDDDYDPGEPVELPEVPRGLSARATKYHHRARNAVARIFLKKNGELQTYQPRFSYYNEYALFLCSTGPLMSVDAIISSLSAFEEYYENEKW